MAVVAGLLLFVLRNGQGEANGLKKAPVERKSGGVFGPELRSFLRNRDVVLTCLTGFCGFWGLYGFVTWANALMIKGHDIGAGTAGLVVAIFAVTAVAVKPLVGLITDRFFGGARKTPSLVIFVVFALTLVWFGNVSSPTAFIWLAPLLGAAAYGWTALLVALIPRLVPSSVTGSVAGISNAIWQLGSVLVPLAVGAVFSATESFNAAFLTLAAGPAMAIVFMLPVRDRAEDRKQATSADPEEKVPESV
ncbi:MFS transporter [Streptomyces sp. NPDC055059]|uniref:MFS transporter n=1 Tax=unclassified Streptomyces TaxID=2593676 RepID=UPI0022546B14|nr:MFS transporter [Streptomyces sp. NBC_00120]MCX5320094.1 MFS transporter [Streptomyces sp. NBC_00120]